ncbi:unnamed protein product, partial [Nesidiocoris tenuis]
MSKKLTKRRAIGSKKKKGKYSFWELREKQSEGRMQLGWSPKTVNVSKYEGLLIIPGLANCVPFIQSASRQIFSPSTKCVPWQCDQLLSPL